MSERSATLLVDVGNTLLARTRPGPFGRACGVLRDRGHDVADHGRRYALARCLLTAGDRERALSDVAVEFGLSTGDAGALRAELELPDGEAILLPGAEALLRTASETGWRVVTTTNAVAWAQPLPPRLSRYVSGVLASSELGFLKQDTGFWNRVLAEPGVDAARSLVVGDNSSADGESPAAAGLCAVVTGDPHPSLSDIAGWMAAAGPPPAQASALAAGPPTTWAGTRVMEVPHLGWMVSALTRCRVLTSLGEGGRRSRSTVVRRRGLPPALVVPEEFSGGLVWLTVADDARTSKAPRDLADALAATGMSLDGLSDRARRHLVSMVREAHDPEIRRSRIDDVLAFLGAPSSERR